MVVFVFQVYDTVVKVATKWFSFEGCTGSMSPMTYEFVYIKRYEEKHIE